MSEKDPKALAALLKTVRSRRDSIVYAVLDWTKKNIRQFEWRRTERTPYSVLLAEILLKRTTSKAVSRIYSELLSKYPDMKSLAAASPEDLRAFLSKVGLQEQRLRGIQDLARYAVREFGGEVPDSYEELRKIPHVGRYTANAVLSFGFGKPSPVVDSNVMRVFGRVFSSDITNSNETLFWRIAGELVPVTDHEYFNWGLLDIGATICLYRKPLCQICPLKKTCDTGATDP